MTPIIIKELLDHLKSIQFGMLLGVSMVLFFVNGITFVEKYEQQSSRYYQMIAEIVKNPSTIETYIYTKPGNLQFISEGGDTYRPNGYLVKPKGVLSALSPGPRNYKLRDIPELDWAFIIKVVFSLYVLLLGYRAISGEKEQGTLRQVLSNSLGRIHLLTAKYLAIILTVLIPLVAGVLISLIVVQFNIPHVFTPANLIKLFLIPILALIYLSIFAFLSLLISSLISRSSQGLLVLLATWVLFSVIIPNISGILSEELSKVPGEYQTAKQVGPMIQQQVWARIDKIRDKVEAGELTTETEVKRETDAAFDQGQQDLIKHYRNYGNAMKQRARLAQKIARLSPTALFQYASENIVETGSNKEEQFEKDARAYSEIYDNYILAKTGNLVGTSIWSFSTDFMINGKSVYISSPYPEEYQGDKTDLPQFQESRPSITRGLKNSLIDLAGLLCWNLLLAVLCFVAFIRGDIR